MAVRDKKKLLPRKVELNKTYNVVDKYGYKMKVTYQKQWLFFGDPYFYLYFENKLLFKTKNRKKITDYLNGK